MRRCSVCTPSAAVNRFGCRIKKDICSTELQTLSQGVTPLSQLESSLGCVLSADNVRDVCGESGGRILCWRITPATDEAMCTAGVTDAAADPDPAAGRGIGDNIGIVRIGLCVSARARQAKEICPKRASLAFSWCWRRSPCWRPCWRNPTI